jgi:hypothetical protein
MRPSSSRVAPVAVLTAAVITGTAGAAPAVVTRTGDVAAPSITALTVNPSPVVLGTKARGRTTFVVAVRATDLGGGVDRVTVGLYDPKDSSGRAFRLTRTSGSAANGLWTGTLALPNLAKRGTWAIRAFATDRASNTTDPDRVYTNFRVTLPTRFRGVDVKADPATGAITAEGTLQRFRPGTGWVPFSKRNVVLEFQPEGANGFLKVATARTDSGGAVRFDDITANGSGLWRASYAGNTGYAATVSGADLVKIDSDAESPGSADQVNTASVKGEYSSAGNSEPPVAD